MKQLFPLKTCLLSLVLLHVTLKINAQDLLSSSTTSYYTYIYSITPDEALKIHRRGIRAATDAYFHTLADSFPTFSDHTPVLPPGSYLKTYSEKGLQKIYITTIHSFDVFVLNNNTDLSIQVYDLSGNLIDDATVKARGKRLRYDRETRCYIDRKSNRKGILSVTHKGNTAYFSLDRNMNNSAIRRGTRTILYGTPVKFVWLPVRYVVLLPVDATRSIIQGWPRGTISTTRAFFRNSFNRIACLFDDSNCHNYNTYKGYMVFNKPKYMPGDTVMFKAFATDKKGKPYNDHASVFLHVNNKTLTLDTIHAYADGGYSYRFFLHDTLNLRLDQHYSITLRSGDNRQISYGTFRYEDYELKSVRLAIRTGSSEHYRTGEVKLFIKGTDENELSLPDARYTVVVTPKDISRYEAPRIFIPDTLYHTSGRLRPSGETEVGIPDSTFPPVTMTYLIEVKLLTSDNQTLTESATISYYWQPIKLKATLFADSIRFDILHNGISTQGDIIVSASDNFDNTTQLASGPAPFNLPVNPFFNSYTVSSDTIEQTFPLSNEQSLIQASSHRTDDSVVITVDNPRKIPFVYNIYSRNNEKARGATDSLQYLAGATPKRIYYLSLRYIWGGKVVENTYSIPFHKNLLNISVDGPALVYPGQKADFEVAVTDAEGKPVVDADLTAWSVTRKFGYNPPPPPSFSEKQRQKRLINNFDITPPAFNTPKLVKLDYEAWKVLAGIDSIEYYRFLYPGESIYTHSTPAPESVTQFAPFIFRNGQSEPIHVIYADNRPVWFSWTTTRQAWSFPVDSGLNNIRIRTDKNLITINSINFIHGHKNIFSIDIDENPVGVEILSTKPILTPHERSNLFRYTFPYRNNFGENYAFLESAHSTHLLKSGYGRGQGTIIAPPVSGPFTLNVINGYTLNMIHEPGFEYDFSPSLAKMRIYTPETLPQRLSAATTNHSVDGFVWTSDMIHREWKTFNDVKRISSARFPMPSSTERGYGRLRISYKQKTNQPNSGDDDVLLNILVFRHDFSGFVRVLPGQARFVNQLEKGYHRLVFFYNNARYHVADSVLVQPNGTTWCEVLKPLVLEHDTFSIKVNDIIEKAIAVGSQSQAEAGAKTIHSNYLQQFWGDGEGDLIEGVVFSEDDGEPLPGTTVSIKGTSIGTITDIDGTYSLRIPPGTITLSYVFIGFEPHDIEVTGGGRLDVKLSPSLMALDEVVVMGYGSQRKTMLAASAISLQTGAGGLQEIREFDIANSLAGKLAGLQIGYSDADKETSGLDIRIRGTSVDSFNKKPLIIINGMVFTGDITTLDQSMIVGMEILKDEKATALYGSAGVNGVIVLTTSQTGFSTMADAKSRGAVYDDQFLEAASAANSLRTNFSDYAFWMPELRTGPSGKASFSVTFPDDVTAWETFYMAMTGHRQSGSSRGMIRSYKPLMAQLSGPRFLTESDTANAIGKIVNYLDEPVDVKTTFEVNDKKQFTTERNCAEAIIDTLPLIAGSDSLIVKYMIERSDGYLDGEQRQIAVFPRGLEVTEGMFATLDSDTAMTLTFRDLPGEARLYARANMLDVVNDDISRLINYRHNCNEQMASKLIALLSERKVKQFKGEKFEGDRHVQRMVRLLSDSRSGNGLWGWWKGSTETTWISLHVLEALGWARAEGYPVDRFDSNLADNLLWKLENSTDFDSRLQLLRMLQLIEAKVNYNFYLSTIEKNDSMSLDQMLRVMELKQVTGQKPATDTLLHYMKTTILGGVYFTDEADVMFPTRMTGTPVQTTVLAYRVLRGDSATSPTLLRKMRNYFMEQRYGFRWLNTYETAQMLTAILPDLVAGNDGAVKPVLQLTGGGLPGRIEKFPFEAVVAHDDTITVSYSASSPVWFTAWQRRWESNPQPVSGDMVITTSIDGSMSGVMKAGTEVTLTASVTMKKEGEYIMINIPIPAGCSYEVADSRDMYETHRENYRNEAAIFCEKLPPGDYQFKVKLLPRYTGSYTLNPAKIELMYFPTFNANNETKRVTIK